MAGVMSQEILNSYQITELRAATNGNGNGHNGHGAKSVEPEADRIRQAEEQIEILNRFFYAYPAAVEAISTSLDIYELFECFTREMVTLLAADSCHVYCYDNNAKAVSLLTTSRQGEWRQALEADLAYQQCLASLVKRAVLERVPIQYALAEPIGYSPGPSAGAKTLMLLPLDGLSEKLTVVAVVEGPENHVFSRHEILSAQQLAAHASIAAQNAGRLEELQAANEQLITTNEALESFAHTVAHDLKGPLATIIGSAEFLKLADESWPANDFRELTGIISDSSHKMLGIINGLLLLAAVGQQKAEIAPVDMESAFHEVRSRLEEMIIKHDAEIIVISDLPAAYGYGPWIEQVWTNLLSNAIKYGGQPPCVEVGATELDDGTVRYWVKDNGQGLTKEQSARLFKPFSRLHTKSVSGHGLGLSIARRIVDRLGGEIGVESELGQGSTFFFTMPGNVR